MTRSSLSRLSLLWGLALTLSFSARAETPSGTYLIDVGGDQSISVPTEIESSCETADGVTLCIDGEISTDGSGAVDGAALFELSGDLEGELEATLSGVVRGSGAKTKVRLAMAVNGEVSSGGLTLDIAAKGRFKCVENMAADGFLCRGKLRLCAFEGGKKVGCESERLDLELGDSGGPWQLRLLGLETDASGAITGDAQVALSTGQILSYDVSGKYSSRKDTANLRLVGTGDAAGSVLALSKVAFEGGGITGGKLAFRIAGQKGKASLPAPSLPAKGEAFSGHGSIIRGSFADVNGDTADLFNDGKQNPSMPFNGVVFFGALGSPSRVRGRSQEVLPQR